MREFDVNPIIKSDYPDPDVIRVEDTYYMISTTMHFLPGGVILRSYDLVNWEIVNYVFDELEDTSSEKMELESTNYGGGMWAASLRFHQGKYYAAFVSHFTKKTYLFTTDDILGKWERKEIEGYYHDCSLLFDDDGRVYLVYGNSDIYLVELKADLSGPKKDGINKLIVSDVKGMGLGYEGSHFYKINGKYYLFLIHWLKTGKGRRTEACFVSDTVDGEYVGKDVLDDDMGFFNQGVAQGGIVDTPNGKWFAVLFRDNGAVGRIPVLVPVKWDNDFPVFGNKGRVPKNLDLVGSRPYYRYEPIFTSDDFKYSVDESIHPKLKMQWQWNHRPDNRFWEILPEGGLKITTNKLCANLIHAKNMLTQRCMYPKCEATVTVDASSIKNGDYAGICILQGKYGFIGITKETGEYYLVKMSRPNELYKGDFSDNDYLPGVLYEKIRIQEPKATFCIKVNFEDLQDKADFFYVDGKNWLKLGNTQELKFGLDHFCGARFGLFMFSTKESGGSAVFTDFDYEYNL